MSEESLMDDVLDIEQDVYTDPSGADTELSRRRFLQALGAGLLITVTQDNAPWHACGSQGLWCIDDGRRQYRSVYRQKNDELGSEHLYP